VQQEKILERKSQLDEPLNPLQEAIYCSFIKFCIFSFSFWCEFFVHLRPESRKNYQHGLDAGRLECQFLQPRGCLTKPFRTLSIFFGVIGKTPGFMSRNNFVKKNFVCIGHRDNVLARRDSDLPFAQVSRSVEQNVHTIFPFPNPLSESEELVLWMFKDSAIILDAIQQ